MDLFVLMDTSNKHNQESFDTIKLYAKGILDEYNLGKGSLITYSSNPEVVVDINSDGNVKDMKKIIDALNYESSKAPKLKQGLNEVIQQLKKRQNTLTDADPKTPLNVLVLSKGLCFFSGQTLFTSFNLLTLSNNLNYLF